MGSIMEYLRLSTLVGTPIQIQSRSLLIMAVFYVRRAVTGFLLEGSGSFEINGNRITFADVNYWTAEFDWNLVLNGEYSLLQTKSTIIIQARKNDVGIYTYELDKN